MRPDFGVFGPGWEIVALWKSLGGVEDGECCGDHGQDDKTASKVDTTKEDLGHAYSDLDFLAWC